MHIMPKSQLIIIRNVMKFDMQSLPLLQFKLNLWLCFELEITLKVAYSQKVFHFDSNLQKKVPNHYSEHYPHKEKGLRRVIWHSFVLEIWAKVKKILRISHLLREKDFDFFFFTDLNLANEWTNLRWSGKFFPPKANYLLTLLFWRS